MAVPKYRPSSRRQGKRRSQHQQRLPELNKCNYCGATKRPHYACPSCGKYNKKVEERLESKNVKQKSEKGSKT